MRDCDFFSWQRETLNTFQSITQASEITTSMQQQTQALEFDYFAFCVHHLVPFTRPKISVQSSYPQAWLEHYQTENYYAIDPVLRPGNFMRGYLPWNDDLFGDTPEPHGFMVYVVESLSA